jgi:hypothetical protein
MELAKDALLTVQELAAFLKVPVSWVYQHSREKGGKLFRVCVVGDICDFRKMR